MKAVKSRGKDWCRLSRGIFFSEVYFWLFFRRLSKRGYMTDSLAKQRDQIITRFMSNRLQAIETLRSLQKKQISRLSRCPGSENAGRCHAAVRDQ